MRILRLALLANILLVADAFAEPPAELKPYGFLIGEWQASGSGQPGAALGSAIFARALQGRVITRTSFAEYPPSAGKPASRHDDLMIIYAAEDGVRADYFDSEGHVIRYKAASPGAGQAVFVSAPGSLEPRFRLIYRLEGNILHGEFATAQPGVPEVFTPYLTWQSSRSRLKK
jgi:hypothetical protein